MLWTANELAVHGYREESINAIGFAIDWYLSHPDKEKLFELAQAYYIAEQYDQSQEILEDLLLEDSTNIDCIGLLGANAARKGDKELSEKISKELANFQRLYLYGKNTCWQARISAILGDKDNAVQLVRNAVAQGFDYYSIHEIIDFVTLHNYPPFMDLIEPKR
jgi:tetratricopeptide (TPR) repeat protein